MSHHKPSRVGRLPRWHRLSTYITLGICMLSGLAFLAAHEWQFNPITSIASRTYLIWHGVSAAFALLAFGSVIPGHIRSAWRAGRNRQSGVAMLSTLSFLMFSGLGLYYGDGDWHEKIVWSHWGIGLVAGIVLPLHIGLGRRAKAREQAGRHPANRSTHIPSAISGDAVFSRGLLQNAGLMTHNLSRNPD